MPLYDYVCECGRTKEIFAHIDERPDWIECECGKKMRRAVSACGIECDSIVDVKWLPSALETLQKNGEKPIETRSEYKRYLKEHNIIAAG